MFGITILGNNSALPAHNRHPTAQAITVANEVLLIDCGEGAQMRCAEYGVKSGKINHIFISHLHGDHYFGLIGWLTSQSLLGRTQDLHVYAPAPLSEIIKFHLSVSGTVFPYHLFFHLLEKEELILYEKQFTVSCFKVRHKIECFGFVIKEKHKPRKLNIEKAIENRVPVAFYEHLQNGEDYISPEGNIIKNELLTTAGKPDKSYAYCADTLFTDTFLPHIKNVDLLYHESTYLNDLREQAQNRFHSTAAEAAAIAKAANAKRLLLGHFSSKYKDLSGFEKEAKEIFLNSEVSVEGVTYLV